MLKTIFLLGRQPNLGLAELESLSSTSGIQQFGPSAAVSDETIDASVIDRLGGTLKIGRVELTTDEKDWNKIEDLLIETFLDIVVDMPEGKINLGISCYG